MLLFVLFKQNFSKMTLQKRNCCAIMLAQAIALRASVRIVIAKAEKIKMNMRR